MGQTFRTAILVTGDAGYIGSHTVRLLHERGREVVAFDSMEFGHRAAVGDVPFVKGDGGDPKAVAEAVERYGIDAVIHFAAYKCPPSRCSSRGATSGTTPPRAPRSSTRCTGPGWGGSSSPRPAPSTGRPSGCRWGRTPPYAPRAPTGRARP